MKILIVDDSISIAETIGDFFELQGLVTSLAFNGEMALEVIREESFDVIVLDVMMPKLDGLGVVTELRAQGNHTPVLMLTARDTLDDRLKGFECGVDDYLMKPFAMEELYARIKAITVRGRRGDVGNITIGELEVSLAEGRAWRRKKPLSLNKVQFSLLRKLAIESPNLVSRQSLEYEIWGDDLPDSDALRTHIYRLRNVIDKGFDSAMIETVHGKGFRIRAVE